MFSPGYLFTWNENVHMTTSCVQGQQWNGLAPSIRLVIKDSSTISKLPSLETDVSAHHPLIYFFFFPQKKTKES